MTMSKKKMKYIYVRYAKPLLNIAILVHKVELM